MIAKESYIRRRKDIPEADFHRLCLFIETREQCEGLETFIESEKASVSTVYRGCKYPSMDLEIGNRYQHFNPLSSWSLNEDVAKKFAYSGEPQEWLFDEVRERLGYTDCDIQEGSPEWENLYYSFEPVVFVLESQEGVIVEEYVKHEMFQDEEEVILKQGNWIMTDIVDKYDVQGSRFVEVTLCEEKG